MESEASFENEKEYSRKLDTQLNFNLLYDQSYTVRSYLHYRVCYRHIQRNINHTTDDSTINQNHTTFNTTNSFLRHITVLLKIHSDDLSVKNYMNFVHVTYYSENSCIQTSTIFHQILF